jgi:uncharacterized protein YegP (UPF0339 family)
MIDAFHLRHYTRRDYGEVRIVATGYVGEYALTIVYTDRGEVRHIISARLREQKGAQAMAGSSRDIVVRPSLGEARKHARFDPEKMQATTHADIARQIAEDPDTAPEAGTLVPALPAALIALQMSRQDRGPIPGGTGGPMHTFEVYKDKAGEYRFRFKASNGEVMFASEGYKAKASALSAIESIRKNATGAKLDDQT